MRFARFVYSIAAVYGFLSLTPLYFLKDRLGASAPPAVTHPEFYYGFVGLALVFQVIFLFVAHNPVRYRPLMPVTVLEKLAFSIPVFLLLKRGAIGPSMVGPAVSDLILGVLFGIAFAKTRAHDSAR